MTASESLIMKVREDMDRDRAGEDLRRIVEVLIIAYREQVRASLRLEETIHKLRKND